MVAAALAAVALGAADPPPKAATSDPKPATAKTTDTPEKPGSGEARTSPSKAEPAPPGPDRSLDRLPVSRETILVICKEVKDALQLVPEGVFLTPAKYKALLDRIGQLERQAKAPKPEVPSSCKLTGQVEGDLVRFQAQFEFRTDRPRTLVTLGCQRAWLKPGAALDGQLPLLIAGDDGQTLVQVEKPGVHQVSLELELPLGTRGAKGVDQGFDLGLPRAAITTLEKFTLPRAVPEVRINGRTLRPTAADDQGGRLEEVPLGPVEHLELTWKGPTSAPRKSPPLLEARGQINVRVTDVTLITDVELSLQVLRGETREWHIRMPPQMVPEVREPRLQDERIDGIDLPDAKNPVLKIRLKEPSAEPLKVVFQVRQARGKTAIPVGLFPVANAQRQRGTIGVSAPPDLRLRFFPRGDVLRRDISEESRRENAVAEFSYGNLPTSANPTQPAQAPLEILVEEIKGIVEARVEHTLAVADQGWRVTTRVLVTPVRTRVDHLDVELPVGFELDQDVGATPAELVDTVVVAPGLGKGRVARIRLVKEQTQPFAVTLPLLGPAGADARNEVLELPRPLQTQDRGGQVTVVLPEGRELTSLGQGPEAPLPGERQHTWRSERFPVRVEFGWRPHRPELAVNAVADVTVAGKQVNVQHRFNFQFGQTARKQVRLAIPDVIADRLKVREGGTLEPNGLVTLAGGGKEQVLALEYSFVPGAVAAEPRDEETMPAPEPTGAGWRFRVPLVRVDGATQSETKVRVWTDPGTLAAASQGPWEERATEVVADRKATLPALVLRSASLDHPLTLALKEPAANPLAAVVLEHALIQAAVEGENQTYRARFWVRLNARALDIEFPAPVALLNPYLLLNGKKLPRFRTLGPNNQESESGTILRLQVEPELYPELTLLEIWYKVPAGATKGGTNWTLTFSPPTLRAALSLGPVYWQVEAPAGWVPVYQSGNGAPGQRWVWRGGLLTPVPAAPAAPPVSAGSSPEPPANEEDFRASLASLQTALKPLDVVQAPRQLWLFACSALLLAVGLGLSFAPWLRTYLVLSLLVLGVAGALAAVWCPGTLPALLYGCEPGLAVLVVVWVVQWTLHQRYRRQVVFMPGFTRVKAGSSLIRRDSNNRPKAEPSTVDGPTQRDSSLQPKED